MKTVVSYFLQVVICSGILYAYYLIALRNRKFHLYNRYFLLATVILGILIPVISIPVYLDGPADKLPGIVQGLTTISSVAHGGSLELAPGNAFTPGIPTPETILRFSYDLIASIVFVRFILAIFAIRKIIRKYPVERTANIYFVNTSEPGTPFSFFKWLFWNKDIDLRTSNGRQIFRHELFHIRQKHSWDVVFMEIVSAVFWINPFFLFIKKELKMIHEFLADQFATNENDKWNYAELLLMQLLEPSSSRLVNPFFHHQIKRRIAMITSSTTPGYQFFRKLMILPVIILVIVLFAFKIKNYRGQEMKAPAHAISSAQVAPVSNILASTILVTAIDTSRPKSKRRTKGHAQQKEIDQNKIESGNEATEFKKLMEEKQEEIQKAQGEFKLLMMEKQREAEKAQEEFKKLMEARQHEAEQKGKETYEQLMEERERGAAKYNEEFKKMMALKQEDAKKAQEEFKKLMEAMRHETEQKTQEAFKQLKEERQKETSNADEEFKKIMMLRQKESEQSREEFKKLLEQRQQEMQKMQEEFQKRMLEKNKKQVI